MFQKGCFIAILNHATYPISLQHMTKTVGSLFKIKANRDEEIKKKAYTQQQISACLLDLISSRYSSKSGLFETKTIKHSFCIVRMDLAFVCFKFNVLVFCAMFMLSRNGVAGLGVQTVLS